MDKSASYIILNELKLIIESYSGNVTIDDVLELKKNEIEDKNYDPDFSFIASLVNIPPVQVSNPSEIKRYIDSIKNDKKVPGNRKSAILTSTPSQVVIGTFYESAAKELPMYYKIFSTVKAAMNWIGVSDEHESVVSECLNKLNPSLPEK